MYAAEDSESGGALGSKISSYAAKIKLIAETTTTSPYVWSTGSPPTTPMEQLIEAKTAGSVELVSLSLEGYLCRLQMARIYCYSPMSRRCVRLRSDRDTKPDSLKAKAGGEAVGVCHGYQMYDEV